MPPKTILITGASGSMGYAAFLELLAKRHHLNLVLLLLPNRREKRLFEKYERQAGIRIVWGDLTRYEDVLEAVTDVDQILHLAALISPAADRHPDLAMRVNVGSIENLLRAIRAQPEGPERIKLVTIGSIAMTGDRLPPIEMGRVGDPLKPSQFDMYAVSKIRAERLVIESGLKHWVSLRQVYIAIPKVFSLMNPIMFHQPLCTALELSTQNDAGRMAAATCRDDLPDDFWGRVYNASGGPSCRITYEEYIREIFRRIGMGDYRKLMERHWFCLGNFHSHFCEDSKMLNDYLDFQKDSLEDHFRQVMESLPRYLRPLQRPIVGRIVPKSLVKRLVMQPLAMAGDGPLGWIKRNELDKIKAFYGSREAFEAIPPWRSGEASRSDSPWDSKEASEAISARRAGEASDAISSCQPGEALEATPSWSQDPSPDSQKTRHRLDHGYDEGKADETLSLADMQSAARFRGGRCLSSSMTAGDLRTPLRWKCAFEHTFEGSPYLILKAGHWCPECEAPPWDHDRIAEKNPFFAQVWKPAYAPQA